ncbi:SCO6745 family protein [Streptomyces angustmyceticus]|nr:MarR family transcriptional regulator [Streptomyces angustmyceticus]
MTHSARRMFELLEPICLVTYLADECNEELAALGHRTYWDGYFASRAAPLGRVPAQVVHAAFYSFADGEVARHIPSAWETIPPEASVAARERGSAASLRRILGDELADSPGLVRAADLTTKAATYAPTEGRMMYAGMRTLPVPGDPVARLWHSATMLREHRCDGHVAALVGACIGGTEAHVLDALARGIHPPESFGRLHHLPKERLAPVMDGLRERGSSTPTAGSRTPAARPSSASKPLRTSLPSRRTTPCLLPNSTSWYPSSNPSPRRWWPRGRGDAQRLMGGGVRRPIRRVRGR